MVLGLHSRASRTTTRLASCLALVAVAGSLAACSETLPPSGRPTIQPTSAPPTTSDLDVPAHALVLVAGQETSSGPELRQLGSAAVDVATSNVSGGALRVEGTDAGPALRFPAYTSAATYPRVVVTVTNRTDDDQLDPGGGDFSYGSDFRLDGKSTGRTIDNGNNMIQRGLSSESTLFKLEVDANLRPTCSVRGSEGEVIARSNLTVLPGVWYRARCRRAGDSVEVSVATLVSGAAGNDDGVTRTVDGPIGIVTFRSASIPISIGGKVAEDGAVIESATDQFNGLLRNPFVVFDH